jgi:hypothetical protein
LFETLLSTQPLVIQKNSMSIYGRIGKIDDVLNAPLSRRWIFLTSSNNSGFYVTDRARIEEACIGYDGTLEDAVEVVEAGGRWVVKRKGRS